MSRLFDSTTNILLANFGANQIPTNGLVFYASFKNSETAETGQTVYARAGTFTLGKRNNINSIGTFTKAPCLVYGPQVSGMPTGSSPRTISAWVRKDATGSTRIFTYGTNSANKRYCLTIDISSFSVFYYNNTAQITGLDSNMIMHKWHHYLHVFDGITNKFYIDGILVGEKKQPNAVDTGDNIGIHLFKQGAAYGTGGGTAGVASSMAGVRCYNRALSEREIKNLAREYTAVDIPSGFRKLEYIENTGKSYINTNAKSYGTWNIECECIDTSSASEVLIGKGTASGQWYGVKNGYYGVSDSNHSDFAYDSGRMTCLFTFTSSGVQPTINGVEQVVSSGTGNSSNVYTLFNSTNKSYPFYGKIFSAVMTITDGEIRGRTLIPLLCTAGNTYIDGNETHAKVIATVDKPGLFDLQTSYFYVNQGDDEFNYVLDSPEGFEDCDYIESFGRCYIDTGIVPDKNTAIFAKFYCTGQANNTTTTGIGNNFFSIGNATSSHYVFNCNLGASGGQEKLLFKWNNISYSDGARIYSMNETLTPLAIEAYPTSSWKING